MIIPPNKGMVQAPDGSIAMITLMDTVTVLNQPTNHMDSWQQQKAQKDIVNMDKHMHNSRPSKVQRVG